MHSLLGSACLSHGRAAVISPWATIRISLRARSRPGPFIIGLPDSADLCSPWRSAVLSSWSICIAVRCTYLPLQIKATALHMYMYVVFCCCHITSLDDHTLHMYMYVVFCCCQVTSLDDHGPPCVHVCCFLLLSRHKP